jgi:P pilus assembly chaperone PapD
VAPITVETDVQPGTAYTASIQVRNEAAPSPIASPPSALRIKVHPMDWTMGLDGTPRFVAAGTLPGSCSKWLEVNPAEFDLQPGQTQEVRYTLTVPAEARGTYRTVLMFEPGSQPVKLRNGGMNVVGRVGSILYATAGPHRKSGRIIGFSATAAGMSLALENTGDDHLRLTGGITVKDGAGKVVREEKLPGAVVLPHQDNRRQLSLTWATPLPAGEYSVTVVVDYGGEELLGADTPIKVP